MSDCVWKGGLFQGGHLLKPVIDELYAFAKNLHVETLCRVSCLVCVHGDSGGEKYGRNTVVNEDSLVGKTVEHVSESLASVIAET